MLLPNFTSSLSHFSTIFMHNPHSHGTWSKDDKCKQHSKFKTREARSINNAYKTECKNQLVAVQPFIFMHFASNWCTKITCIFIGLGHLWTLILNLKNRLAKCVRKIPLTTCSNLVSTTNIYTFFFAEMVLG